MVFLSRSEYVILSIYYLSYRLCKYLTLISTRTCAHPDIQCLSSPLPSLLSSPFYPVFSLLLSLPLCLSTSTPPSCVLYDSTLRFSLSPHRNCKYAYLSYFRYICTDFLFFRFYFLTDFFFIKNLIRAELMKKNVKFI